MPFLSDFQAISSRRIACERERWQSGGRGINRTVIAVSIALLLGSSNSVVASGPIRCADELLASLRAEFGIPGLAVAVRKGSNLVYSRALGDAHVELGVPVTPSTIFQLSSSSKLFAGLVTMRLVEQGKLALSDPVTKHLPEAPASWQTVTIRHLASMTARLPDLSEDDSPAGDERTEVEILAALGEQSPEFLLSRLFAKVPNPDSGTGWKYGDGDFFVLQQVIERVTGKAFEEVVREQVFEEVGMVSATYWSSDEQVVEGSEPDITRTARAV